jgi:steroid delta-isomerase-like uncharacterized protein
MSATGAHEASDPANTTTLARRYFQEILNEGDFSRADALLAPEFVFRNPPVLARGRSAFEQVIQSVRRAFPDLRFVIEDEIAEGNKVVFRWRVTGTQTGAFLGHPPSGRAIDVTGINIFRIDDGRIQEIWVNMDRLGEAEQLGWVGPSC